MLNLLISIIIVETLLLVLYIYRTNKNGPPRPDKVSLSYKLQGESMSSFKMVFALPIPGASDVANRELSVTINGSSTPEVRTYPNDPANPTLRTDDWEFNSGDVLDMVLVDVDGSGNRSQPSANFHYSVIDDVPPPQPGEIGVISKEQLN